MTNFASWRSRRHPTVLIVLALALASAAVAVAVTPSKASAAASTFVVNTSDRSSPGRADGVCDVDDAAGQQCSLADAITEANAAPGRDTIRFDVPSPYLISLNADLITITDPVTIDGTSQPGYSPRDGVVVRLDGTRKNFWIGLDVAPSAGGSTIRGLAFTRWGAAVRLRGDDTTVSESYFGLAPSGRDSYLGSNVGVYITGSRNTVGGASASARNVFGFNDAGVIVENQNFYDPKDPGVAADNSIMNNYFGLGPDGRRAAPNGNFAIAIDRATGTRIGAPGAGNLIAHTGDVGLSVLDSTGTTVSSNAFGYSATGGATAPNLFGMEVRGESRKSSSIDIVENQFSNRAVNITVEGGMATVRDNLIGSSTTVSNGRLNDEGLQLRHVASARVRGNTISGHYFSGVQLTRSSNVVLTGNLIGTDPSGERGVGNAVRDKDSGAIEVCGGTQNRIGRAGAEPNVIAGNGGAGVDVSCSARNVRIENNIIGRSDDGMSPLPNAAGLILDKSAGARIGDGTAAGSNVIADNRGSGVVVGKDSTNGSVSNNVITGNGRIGIDLLGSYGPSGNDAGDTDHGGNDLQNFPVLTRAAGGEAPTIEGTLRSRANREYRLEFYANDECDPSGHGEGQRFIGSVEVSTDGDGRATFSTKPPGARLAAGDQVTATATDVGRGETSEFSVCR